MLPASASTRPQPANRSTADSVSYGTTASSGRRRPSMAPVFRSPRAQHAACSKATWRRSAGGIARFSARTAAGCWRRGSCAPPSALGWSMMRPGSRGYTFGRPAYRYHQLGPVVAAATARDMVIRCLSPLGGRVFAIDVPLLDGEWLDFLKSAGFVEERRFVRMFLRGHVHPGIPAKEYAICGPEFA